MRPVFFHYSFTSVTFCLVSGDTEVAMVILGTSLHFGDIFSLGLVGDICVVLSHFC